MPIKSAKPIDAGAPSIRLRVLFGGNAMLGPGKAELLETIGEAGSISAAGRKMGMSYKRAWMLVETLNGIFHEPLVEASRGGASGGGARLTATGQTVLRLYRLLESHAATAGKREVAALQSMLRDIPGKK